MLARERRGALVERERGGDGGRVVRRVQPQDRDAVPVDGVEVGQPAVRRLEPQFDDLRPGEQRAARGHGVAGRRHRDPGARAADDLGEPEDRLLRAERRDDLGRRVEVGAEAAREPAGDRGPQLRQALGLRVARDRLGLDRLGDGAADERRRLLARLARPEVDDPRAAGGRGRLRLVEAHERVGAETGRGRGSAACEALQGLVAADERVDRDLLVAPVRVLRVAGAEVHRVDAGGGELRDRRPGLLGLDGEVARRDEPLHEVVLRGDRAPMARCR